VQNVELYKILIKMSESLSIRDKNKRIPGSAIKIKGTGSEIRDKIKESGCWIEDPQ
jgi:hypothetical protein